jgi:tRNA A-37 threonylcarbamoyl transferase component Bud32
MPFTLSDYTDIQELAKGGMGKIYLATQISLNRKVVIKEMAGGLLTSKNESKRFENEAQAGAALNHDNIVRIYDFGEEKGSFYIAMEFIDGPDLDQLLKQNDFPREIGLMVLHQALKGLAHAHEHGIVHRDVKPANMLVSSHGAVKMVDFGLAYAGTQSGQLTTTGAIVGTPPYMSPELVSGEETRSECMDIWAAGVILYRIVTGSFPFTGDNVPTTLINIMQSKEKPAEEIDRTLPEPIAVLLQSSLTKDHTKRLSCLSPLIEALQNHFFDIGIRDPAGMIKKYFIDKGAAVAELGSFLFAYHLARGKECATAMKYSAALAHFQEARKHDPKNKEVAQAMRSLEDYVGSALSSKTAVVEKGMLSQVRAAKRKKAGHFPFVLTALVVISLSSLSAVGVAFYKPELWGRVKGIAHSAKQFGQGLIRGAMQAGGQVIGPAAPEIKPEPQKYRELPTLSQTTKKDSAADGWSRESVTVAAVRPSMKPGADSGAPNQDLRQPPQVQAQPPAIGMVKFEVSPLSAIVKVDNKALSAQEMGGTMLAAGNHQILASADGFAPSTTLVAVAGSDTHLVMIGLTREKKTGELNVLSDITAELYIDGELRGTAPTASPLLLSEGEHSIVFKRPGFKPFEKTVTIQAGEIKQVRIGK